MNHLEALPPWAALLVAALVLTGALFAFIGSLGLLRLGNFYQRVHAPTLGTTLGTFLVLAASITCFSVLQSRPVFHELLIGVFLMRAETSFLQAFWRSTVAHPVSAIATAVAASTSGTSDFTSIDTGVPAGTRKQRTSAK